MRFDSKAYDKLFPREDEKVVKENEIPEEDKMVKDTPSEEPVEELEEQVEEQKELKEPEEPKEPGKEE